MCNLMNVCKNPSGDMLFKMPQVLVGGEGGLSNNQFEDHTTRFGKIFSGETFSLAKHVYSCYIYMCMVLHPHSVILCLTSEYGCLNISFRPCGR